MTQYPNEKDPHSDWVYPAQGASYPYTSRDGAPPATSSHASPPPQGFYPSPAVPPQGYFPSPAGPPQGYFPPPTGPPPDYGYATNQDRSPYDHKVPHETVLAPPPIGSNDIYTPSDPGMSSSSSAQDGGNNHTMSLGSFFGNKGTPMMWNRPAPPNLPYNAFPPMCLISNGNELSGGFPELPPPCQQSPHPFATHDVTEEDWKRFLADVKKAGALSPAQRIKSNVIPMVTGMSFFTGFMATMAIERKMKYNNRGAAGDLVDHWNHFFFGPRRMEVVLSQGSDRLSGKLGPAPVGDPNQERMANGLRRGGDSSDDSSSDDDRRHGHNNRGDRRAARRERREARRAKKAERREWKSRGDNKQPYQLFITSI